jgi:processive 1,2-diacylglycerol beta-glucosyltransferase
MPCVTVVTDFDVHGLWIQNPCDLFCVASEEAVDRLRSAGVPSRAIRLTGIPIHPLFEKRKMRDVCRIKHGLKGHRPVVLLMAGGLRRDRLEEAVRSIFRVQQPVLLAVSAGRNGSVEETVRRVPLPARHRLRLFGMTRAVDELMAASDVMVSKPGGLTSAEALAAGLPMIIIHPIPGQEERNSDHLLQWGGSWKANEGSALTHHLSTLLSNDLLRETLRQNALRAGRPQAARDAAQCILSLSSPGVSIESFPIPFLTAINQ